MRVTVLGAGIMGSGIAQLAASAGHDVLARDVGDAQIQRARSAIDGSLARFVKAGKLTETGASDVRARIAYTTEVRAAADGAEVVIEAVPEVLELKREVLAQAVPAAAADALIGTNTSQLSITSIGRDLGGASARLIGMHFFNPPVMMKLTELICGLNTSPQTLERARAFVVGLGRTAVVCRRDTPGFLTSRAYAAFRLECVRMLEEGLATAEDIDTAFRLGFNLPMGPLELGDFNGIDTFVHALDSLSDAYGERFRTTPILRNMVAAGHLGRKTGKGFYDYEADGKRLET